MRRDKQRQTSCVPNEMYEMPELYGKHYCGGKFSEIVVPLSLGKKKQLPLGHRVVPLGQVVGSHHNLE